LGGSHAHASGLAGRTDCISDLRLNLKFQNGVLYRKGRTVAEFRSRHDFPATLNVPAYVGGFSVSATGLIAYRLGGGGLRQLTWFDRSGKTLGTMGEEAGSRNERFFALTE
jgi:hypothetical protein